jgi:hypothetical protein
MKLSKSTTEILKMLHEAFGVHSLNWTAVFEQHSHFKAGRVSVEGDECSRQPSTSKMTENVEKIPELIHEDSLNNPWARRHQWDQLWSLPGDLNRKFEPIPHCRRVCFPTIDK